MYEVVAESSPCVECFYVLCLRRLCCIYMCVAKVKRVNVRNLPTLLIEVQRGRDIL